MADVTCKIDGQSVTVPKGTLIVEAARKLGIEIPVYCYHPKLAPVGACRVCVVNVEGQRRPIMPACATEVTEGMVVHTRDEAATKAREGVLELLLINHPLDCPVCDRGGECDLQDFTLRYGPEKSRFTETKRHFPKSVQVGREVVLDRERCIMCMRCVRFCDEAAVEKGLTIIERGTKAEIGPFPGESFDSQFSGNTVEICPVGALTSKSYRFRSRPWELQNFASVCNHCAVGCNITVDVRYWDVVRFRSRCNDAIDDGWLCDRGRYGYKFIGSDQRLQTPLVRKGSELVPASWDEALRIAAEGLKKYSGNEIGALAGPRLSNEGGWLLTRLIRGLLDSPNLDQRRGSASLQADHKPWPLHAKIEALDTATAVVIVNCDPTVTHPVLDLRIKKALQKGAELIVIGDNELVGYADHRVTDVASLRDAYEGLPEPQPAGLNHPRPRPWEPGGKTNSDVKLAAQALQKSPRVVYLFAEDTAPVGLPELVAAVGSEAPHGMMMLVAGANSVGLREMGVLPVLGPGWQSLPESQATFRNAWGGFNSNAGMDAAKLQNGGVKALILVAEDKLEKKPEFLVSLDMFLSPATSQADVVFPACSFAEQVMTMTNVDGTVQLCRQALAPRGDSLPDWQILHRLAQALGQTWETDTAAKIFKEIGQLNPVYQGASYASFQTDVAEHWSYPQQGRIGTPRPDLSGIPVKQAEASPWMPAVPMGSKVERVARLLAGEPIPAVPGQEDPRRVASRLALELAVLNSPSGEEPARRIVSRGAQPPGPSPAERYHAIGMAPRELPASAELPPAVEEAVAEETEAAPQ